MKTLHRKWVIFFIMCVIIMEIMSAGYTKVRAATVNDANVFLKQQTNYTCTLTSAAMMLRRRAIVDGNTNWASITESSLRSTAWLEGTGLYFNFTYAGMKVGHNNFPGELSSKKTTLINLLSEHPEGIEIYDINIPHAILITDYDQSSGTFYCADPAGSVPAGRIKLTQSFLAAKRGANQDTILNNCSAYWYITNKQGGGTGVSTARPGRVTLKNMRSAYSVTDTIQFSWDATANTTHYNFVLYKKYPDVGYKVLERTFRVTSGLSRTLSEGEYKVVIQSYNSNAWEADGSDWIHTLGNESFFTVKDNITPGKPYLKNMKSVYHVADEIAFSWDSTVNTTHYNFVLYKKYPDVGYKVLERKFRVTSGLTRTFSKGEYKVMIQSYNSNAWRPDKSDWIYTLGDEVFFSVIENNSNVDNSGNSNVGTGGRDNAKNPNKNSPDGSDNDKGNSVENGEENKDPVESDTSKKRLKQPMRVTPGIKKYSAAKLKKKARTFKITVKKAKGKVTYKSSNRKYVKVTSKGKVTVKKKTPKGTYKITVRAGGNKKYRAGTKTIKVQVK